MDVKLLSILPGGVQKELLILAILSYDHMMGVEGFLPGRIAIACGLPVELVEGYMDALREHGYAHREGELYYLTGVLSDASLYDMYMLHCRLDPDSAIADPDFSIDNLRPVRLQSFLFGDPDQDSLDSRDFSDFPDEGDKKKHDGRGFTETKRDGPDVPPTMTVHFNYDL